MRVLSSMVSSGRVFRCLVLDGHHRDTEKGNHVMLLRAKEFIKYHVIISIVNNLLLIIHVVVVLSFSFFLYSKNVKADEHFEREPWAFSSEPRPMIFKHGNVTHGNKFFIFANQNCSVQMFGWFTSYNKLKVKELEGKVTDLRFELLTEQAPIYMSKRNRVSYILGTDKWGDTPMPFSVAHVSLGRLDKITRLLDMRKDGVIGFRLTAPTDEYFDVPQETWGFEGIEEAVSKILKWCGPKA